MQDEMHKRYKHGSAIQMMCWMNFWCGGAARRSGERRDRLVSAHLLGRPATGKPSPAAPSRSSLPLHRCGLYYLPLLFGATNMGQELIAFCAKHPDVRRVEQPLLFCSPCCALPGVAAGCQICCPASPDTIRIFLLPLPLAGRL